MPERTEALKKNYCVTDPGSGDDYNEPDSLRETVSGAFGCDEGQPGGKTVGLRFVM